MSKKILLLSANLGSGHLQASLAIKQALLEIDPEIKILIVDTYRHADSLMGKIVEDSYLRLVKFLPQIYGYLYERREKSKKTSTFIKWINHLSAGNFKELIENFNPNCIICTQAYACGINSALKEKYNLNIPSIAVITDFVPHPLWIYKNLDIYAAATEEAKTQLLLKGLSPSQVIVTGIPVRTTFNFKVSNISILKDKLNLNKGLPVLLVMGGGLGIGPVEKIMRLVKNINLALHIVIIAGKNNKLKKKLEDLAGKIKSSCEIKILGYVENIHEYMRSADLLITKAGGLTIAEALCSELPMLIVKPIPGQELRNTKFLLTKRVALRVNKENKLTKLVEELILNPERLKKMREKTKVLARPDAAEKIAHLAVHLINKRKIEKRQITG